MSDAYTTLVDLALLLKHEGSDTRRVQDLLVQLGREIKWMEKQPRGVAAAGRLPAAEEPER